MSSFSCQFNRSTQHTIKQLGWCFVIQGLAWPLILLTRHGIQLRLRVYRQIAAFGKILFQQAIGVLIGTALPGALWIKKVDLDIGGQVEQHQVAELMLELEPDAYGPDLFGF